MQPHSITIDYYIVAFPTNVSSFIRRVAKETLALNFAEEIIVEKDLRVIGVITNDDESKDYETGRKSQPSSSKAKERESLTITLKSLTNEVSELKRRSSKTSTSSKPPKSFQF